MVAPLIAWGLVTAASIIGPPIVQWIGDQTWNKQNADNAQKLAEAAAYDQKQREEAAKTGGVNPYLTTQTTTTGSGTDIMGMMMPMLMMMMMLPMMQNMFKNRTKQESNSDYDDS